MTRVMIPKLNYQNEGRTGRSAGVRLQIDRNAPWGVEPRAFQAPDLLVIPLLPGRGWPAVSGGASNGRTQDIAPSHSGVTKLISCRIQSSIQQVDRLPRRTPPPPLTRCPRFSWTAICPTGGSQDEVQHEQDRTQRCE